jgi:glutathione S-transferase
MSELKVFTFSPSWGLPTGGPFALKLIKWLELAGLPYRQVYEENSAKGPKGKSPWVELDGARIGDSEVIIELLAKRSGFDVEAGLAQPERAMSHAVRRMLEEHFHQVLEWELCVHPEGAKEMRRMVERAMPKLVAGAIAGVVCGKMGKQLGARGIARHSEEVIAAKGRADVDTFEALLGGKPLLFGDRPSMADIAAYGLLAPMAKWPMHTPVADYIKSRPAIMAYLDRVGALRAEQRLAA